jgi:hypothetical protein
MGWIVVMSWGLEEVPTPCGVGVGGYFLGFLGPFFFISAAFSFFDNGFPGIGGFLLSIMFTCAFVQPLVAVEDCRGGTRFLEFEHFPREIVRQLIRNPEEKVFAGGDEAHRQAFNGCGDPDVQVPTHSVPKAEVVVVETIDKGLHDPLEVEVIEDHVCGRVDVALHIHNQTPRVAVEACTFARMAQDLV